MIWMQNVFNRYYFRRSMKNAVTLRRHINRLYLVGRRFRSALHERQTRCWKINFDEISCHEGKPVNVCSSRFLFSSSRHITTNDISWLISITSICNQFFIFTFWFSTHLSRKGARLISRETHLSVKYRNYRLRTSRKQSRLFSLSFMLMHLTNAASLLQLALSAS